MSYLKELLGDTYTEGMSEEELSKAIEKAVSTRDKEAGKVKKAFDKTSSEIADYKRQLEEYKKQLAEKMSEDERAKAEQEELLETLKQQNEDFKKKIAIAESKAQLTALGYSEEMAAETAEALYSGDFATLYKNQKTVMEEKAKEIRAGVIKDTPTPPAGGASGTGMTLEKLRSLSVKERFEFSQTHPEEYEALYSNGKE